MSVGCPCVRCQNQKVLQALTSLRKAIMNNEYQNVYYDTIAMESGPGVGYPDKTVHTFITVAKKDIKEPIWAVEFE